MKLFLQMMSKVFMNDGEKPGNVRQFNEFFISKERTKKYRVRDMMFYITFNNISVISWQSVLLVDETGVPKENHRPVASY